MSTKVVNAVKATAIVLGFCCAALAAALMVALGKVAKDVLLIGLAILSPFAVLALAIYLVYRYLEAR